jgi:hypothetical protein
MPWTATPIVWTIRWGKDHYKFGDPYEGTSTLQRTGYEGYVSATVGEGLRISEMREFFKFCKAEGIAKVGWEHHDIPQEVATELIKLKGEYDAE